MMEPFKKEQGLEAAALFKQRVQQIGWIAKIQGNCFQGVHELPDGRVIEVYLEFGWFYLAFVFENRAAWEQYEAVDYSRNLRYS